MNNRPKISMYLVIAALAIMLTLPATISCSRPQPERSKVLIDADSTYEHALTLYDDAEYAKSLDMARVALGVYLRHDDKELAGDCYAHMAACYQRLGDVDSGISNTVKCMELDEQLGDLERLSSTYSNLAALYLTAQRPKDGLPLILKAINIENSLDSSPKLSIRYGIAAETYLKLEQTDSALSYASRALDLDRKAHDTIKVARRLSVLGDVYAATKAYDKAADYYQQAINLLESKDEHTSLMITRQHLGKLYLDNKQYEPAIAQLEKSTQLAEKSGAKLILQRNYTYLAEAFKRTDPSRAVDYMMLSSQINDSINRHETDIITSRYAAQFETKDKELTIEKQAKQLQRQRYVIATIVVLALIMLLACLALYYIMRLKAKTQRQTKRIEQERQDIFTGVTHAFRTPLTVILGHANALKDQQPASSQQAKALNAIIEQGNSMLQMVGNLLDISQLTERYNHNLWRHGNIVQLAGMSIELIQQQAVEKHITIDFAPEQNDIQMDFVPQYITKIVTNVLSTAVEFAQRGGKVISTMNTKSGRLLFSTIIGGEGISSRHFELLLNDTHSYDSNDTTGIALTLVKQLAAAMNGHLDVMTIKDSGTIISVDLPINHATGGFPKWVPDDIIGYEPVTINSEEEVTLDDSAKPTVLIVEDNIDVARYIESVLIKRYNVMHAHNGREGLEKAREFKPSVIVTDLVMPVMDGIEMCRHIREYDEVTLTPIIMVTARVDVSDSINALTAGADAVLHKPFDSKLLLATIDRLTQIRQSMTAHAVSSDWQQKTTNADAAFLTTLNNAIMQAIADPDLSSSMLADKLCLSQRQLNRKVKAITDNDTATYIRLSRVALAKRLLATTDMQIADVVVKCGFDSPSYFAKVFKQTAGMTPSEYRKNRRSEA